MLLNTFLVKGTVIFDHFLLKRFDLGPIWTEKNDFAHFREHLCENEKFRETVFACSYGAQVEFFYQKKSVKNLVTLSINDNKAIA